MARKPPKQTEKQRRATAYHEASRAVVALRLGLTIRDATIIPSAKDGYGGRVRFRHRPPLDTAGAIRDPDNLGRVLALVTATLAGAIGEAKHIGKNPTILDTAGRDARTVSKLTGLLCRSRGESQAFLLWHYERATALLGDLGVRGEVEGVAEQLLEVGRLTGAQVSSAAIMGRVRAQVERALAAAERSGTEAIADTCQGGRTIAEKA